MNSHPTSATHPHLPPLLSLSFSTGHHPRHLPRHVADRLRSYKSSRRHVTILVTAHANVHIPDGFKCGKLLRAGPDESGPDRPPIVGRVVDGVIFPLLSTFANPTLFHYLLPKPHIAYVCMCVCISPLRTKVSHPSVRREARA